MTSEIDPLGGVTQHVLDKLGREIQTILPDPDGPGGGNPLESPVWQFTFDVMSNLVSTVDPMAAETTYEFDSLNRRIKTTDAESGETSFVFDSVNNLVSLTDSVGNTTTWFRDNLNRVIEEENENEDSRYFQYDAASNLTQRTDRNGRVTQWDHDNLGRTIAERWMDGVTALHTITYVLDAASQLTEASDAFSSYAYVFDNLGRVNSVDNDGTPGQPNVVLNYVFDVGSNRTSVAASVGATPDFKNDYTFDTLHRTTRIEQHDQSGGNSVAEKRVDLAYNAVGQYTSVDRFADLAGSVLVATSSYSYDDLHRLIGLDHAQGATALAGYAYTYDAASRVHSVDSLTDGLATFSYDATSQLTGADHTTQADEAHTWDANGNPLGEDFEVEADNTLHEDANFVYEHDAEGNLIKKTDKVTGDYVTYGWDHRNRLTSVAFYDSEDVLQKKIEYDYDLFDRRIAKRVDDDGDDDFDRAKKYVYDGEDIVLVFDDTGSLTSRFLHGPGADELFADEQFVDDVLDDVYYPLTDHLGSVRDVAVYDSLLEETSIAKHLTLDSFGKILTDSAPSLPFLYAFTGREWDPDAQLYYYRARWFSPDMRRFISKDPIGFAAGDTNDRRYVGNDATNATDPSGLDSITTGSSGAVYWRSKPGTVTGFFEGFVKGTAFDSTIGVDAGDVIAIKPEWGGGYVSLAMLKKHAAMTHSAFRRSDGRYEEDPQAIYDAIQAAKADYEQEQKEQAATALRIAMKRRVVALGRDMRNVELSRDTEPDLLERIISNQEGIGVDINGAHRPGDTVSRGRDALTPTLYELQVLLADLVLRKEYRDVPMIEWVKLGLDILGMLPVVGEPFDVASGAISLYQGNFCEAGLTVPSVLPLGGQLAGGAKLGLKIGIGTGFSVGAMVWLAKHLDELAKAKPLVRYGGRVTPQQLAAQAAAAEANPAYGIHGVSVILRNPPKGPHGQAEFEAAMKGFGLVQTGPNKSHYTVIIPKDVTPEVADRFNALFTWFE